MERSNKRRFATEAVLLAAVWVALGWAVVHAQIPPAPPNNVKTCSKPITPLPAGDGSCGKVAGVTACGPTKPTDPVYVQIGGKPSWVALSAVTPATLVADCTKGTFAAYSTFLPPPPPPVVPKLAYNLVWDGAITNLDGTTITDLTGYQVAHALSVGGPWDMLSTVTTLSAAFPALESDVQQCFSVTTMTAHGNSSPAVLCVLPVPPATKAHPQSPQNVRLASK